MKTEICLLNDEAIKNVVGGLFRETFHGDSPIQKIGQIEHLLTRFFPFLGLIGELLGSRADVVGRGGTVGGLRL